VTVRDPEGKVVGTFTTPFLPQSAQLDSLGVIKIPDGLAKQVGLRGYFYPDPVEVGDSGLLSSFSPTAGKNSMLSLQVYTGDLKLDDGVPVNAYSLDTTGMTELVGPNSTEKGLRLEIGKAVDLPDGLGSVELTGWKRFVSLETHHDPSQLYVATFAVLAVLGLLTSLFIPRRRVWVTATDDGDGSRLEYAGLARGDDPRLEEAVASIAWQHLDRLGERPAWTVGRGGPDVG
jgi:cytochrome c biogenesis protein